MIGTRDFKAFIGQRKQAQGRSWGLTKEGNFVCMGRKKMMKCEEGFFSSYVWRGIHGKVMKK